VQTPQNVSEPSAQAAPHCPAEQTGMPPAGTGQALPQLPQLLASLCTLVQSPLHSLCPAEQRQMPPAQMPLAQSPPLPQRLPWPQPAQGPPQSRSLSPPFWTPSLQVAAWQTPPWHTPLLQATLHSPQFSGSADVSVQVPLQAIEPAGQQVPFEQWALAQSPATRQRLPFWQAGQNGPPRSTSVSCPFAKPSGQLFTQMPVRHSPVRQSLPELQRMPLMHGEQEPPQSMSLSSKF
jgi:hypothetical protein